MNRRRRIKKRKSRKKLAYGFIAVVLILACFLAYFSLRSSNQKTSPDAVIVDHLSFFPEQRNPTFVNACKSILENGGLTWAYYRGEDITVDFYRNLPSYGNSLIILRVHSAIMRVEGGTAIALLGLFTSELYSPEAAQKYPEDIEDGRLVRAFFTNGSEEYFGIVPKFVEKSMKGEFENTIIIMMGCDGLGYINTLGTRVPYTDMAEAFRKRGAKVYIGWNGPVGVNHTDQATLDLLQSLIREKQTIKEAVEKVDADPDYKSELKFYPLGAENYHIPNLRSSLVMNVACASPTSKTPKSPNRRLHR